MTPFTIFRNSETREFAAVYDFNLPTMTGIDIKEEWRPVYHGQANGLLDKSAQCKAFAERYRSEK